MLQTGQLNGLPVLNFDGLNDYLQGADAASLDPAQYTFFAVGSCTSGGSLSGVVLIKSTGTTWNDGYGASHFHGMWANTQASWTTVTSGSDAYALFTGLYDQQNVTVSYNGLSVTGSNYTLPITPTAAPLYIGGQATNFAFRGNIAEILLYGRALSTQEQLAVETYLQQKYQTGFPALVAPVFSNTSGTTFTQPSQVALKVPGNTPATIYYTRDGSAPTTSSTVYTGPIWVAFTSTIKAVAAAPGYTTSGTTTAIYTLSGTQWPAPVSGTTVPQIGLDLPYNTVPHP